MENYREFPLAAMLNPSLKAVLSNLFDLAGRTRLDFETTGRNSQLKVSD